MKLVCGHTHHAVPSQLKASSKQSLGPRLVSSGADWPYSYREALDLDFLWAPEVSVALRHINSLFGLGLSQSKMHKSMRGEPNSWTVNLACGTRRSDDSGPSWIMLKNHVEHGELVLTWAPPFHLGRETPKGKYPSNPSFTLGGVSFWKRLGVNWHTFSVSKWSKPCLRSEYRGVETQLGFL